MPAYDRVMRFQIGRRPDGVESVESALLDCHGRIRDMTALASRLASSVPAADDEVVEAATRVSRYFSESLPLHEADEEESLRPRLIGMSEPVDSALADMTAQHGDMHAHVDELVALTSSMAAEPSRRGDDGVAEGLARVVATLEDIWERHLALEETVLLPAVTELDDATKASMRAEMKARRGE